MTIVCFGDISKEDARGMLQSAPVRARRIDAQFGSYLDLEAFIDGRWRNVCRTDAFDEVATGNCFDLDTTVEHMRAEYLECIVWGARILKPSGSFACIDALTDG